MPSPTWAEYLAGASRHLTVSRRAVEVGAPPPPPPARPEAPLPEGLVPEARELAIGYAQLGSEVSARMERLRHRMAAMPRTRPALPPARYVDTPA